MQGFFITGTDTEIGKTEVSTALLCRLNQLGHLTCAMKPVASGCEVTEQGLRNSDACKLRQAANIKIPYDIVNPYAFEPAIAPHLAAELQGVSINQDVILQVFHELSGQARYTVVEGVGGWLVPLNATYMVENLARDLQLPVILVVGLRLGCLNHALLSEKAILDSGCTLAGWIGNHMSAEFPMSAGNIQTLHKSMQSPNLGILPYIENVDPEQLANYLNIDGLV